MKPYQRRQTGNLPYYKLAVWDAVSLVWRDGKTVYPNEQAAIAAVSVPGKYRVSRVDADGRHDLKPFEVGEMVGGD